MGKRKLTDTQNTKITSYFGSIKKAKPTPDEGAATSSTKGASGASVKKVWTKEDLPKTVDRFSLHYPKGVADEILEAWNKQ